MHVAAIEATNRAMPKPLWSPAAADDLDDIPAHDRRKVLDQVLEQLSTKADSPAKKRKKIEGLVPPWSDIVGEFWQLRVDPCRVFYDVEDGVAIIRAIRRKPHGKTTKEIL